MLPAVAGAVVPIYNIPNLANTLSPLILSRHVLAQIFLGNIRSCNDPSILNVQVPAVKAILAHCNQTIKVVVRTDSSGTTDIFSSASALFQPASTSNPFPQDDFSFANVAGHGQTPTWCGPTTDEVQILTTTSCDSSLSPLQRVISLRVVTLGYAVRTISFACDASAAAVLTAFEAVYGAGSMKVYRSQSSTASYVFTIGYWITGTSSRAPGLTPKNMYEPFIESTGSVGAYITTLQEGGYLNAHYNTTFSVLPEKQSVFVNASTGVVFGISNPNDANPAAVSSSVTIANVSVDYSGAILSVVNALSPALLSAVTRVKHVGGWDEYQLFFTSPSNVKQLEVIASSYIGNSVIISTLQHGSNYPVFYDSSHPQGFGNSGKYTCYRHDHNLTAWSYYTGSGNPGVVAEVGDLQL